MLKAGFFSVTNKKFILSDYLLKDIKNLDLNFENCFYTYIKSKQISLYLFNKTFF